jgi:hypothetical protein
VDRRKEKEEERGIERGRKGDGLDVKPLLNATVFRWQMDV